MRQLLVWIALGALAGGCRSVPLNSNLQADQLLASPGVLAYFTDPDVDVVEASGNITCRRHRRVGTHLISKVCRTNDEWADLERKTRETHMDHRTAPICVATEATGSYMRNGPGALLPTGCGDAINRGGGG